MRKIIIIYLMPLFIFSQEEKKDKVFESDFTSNFNKQRIRVDKSLINDEHVFRFGLTHQETHIEVSIGYFINLEEDIFLIPTIGSEYNYNSEKWTSISGLGFRLIRRWGRLNLDYGLTDFNDHRFGSKLYVNAYFSFVRIGIVSRDLAIGPGIEVNPRWDSVVFRFRAAYVDSQIIWNIRFSPEKLFKKIF